MYSFDKLWKKKYYDIYVQGTLLLIEPKQTQMPQDQERTTATSLYPLCLRVVILQIIPSILTIHE